MIKPVSFARPVQPEPRLSKPYVPGRHSKRYWTDDERAVVARYYSTGGVSACLAHLGAHRTTTSVYQEAQRQGLAKGQSVNRHEFTAELDATIREEWAQLDGKKRGEVAALADKLGMPRHVLSQRARKLGLTIAHRKEPRWTAAEDALMHKVPLHDPDRCARIFHQHGFRRSATAIVVRAKRLELSRRQTRTTLSARAAAKIIGVDTHFVTSAILAGELRAEKRADKRLSQQGGSAWDIEPANLRAFVVEFLERIDLRKVDKFAFVQLLTGEASS